jgi:hypothetical protein
MKKITILVLLLATLFSCKKNKTDTPTLPEVVYKIKTEARVDGSNVRTYTYDTDGRLLKNDGTIYRYEYSYSANTATEKYYNTNLVNTTLHELNADGLVSKESYSDNSGVLSVTIYTYNTNKQVQKTMRTYTASGFIATENYFYTGKAVDSVKTTFSNNADVWKIVYEYYTDKKPSTNYKNLGINFYADRSDKLVKKITFTAYIAATNTNNPPQISDITYSFDALDRVTQRVFNGQVNSSNNYTYY